MCAGWTRRGVCLGLVLAGAAPARAADLPRMVVTKDPSCGCCRGWAEHVRAAGFPIEIVESASVGRLKARLGVPQDLAGCHTAEVGGYVVEGHVPAAAIRRLLEERPAATGACGPRHAGRLAGHGGGGLVPRDLRGRAVRTVGTAAFRALSGRRGTLKDAACEPATRQQNRLPGSRSIDT